MCLDSHKILYKMASKKFEKVMPSKYPSLVNWYYISTKNETKFFCWKEIGTGAQPNKAIKPRSTVEQNAKFKLYLVKKAPLCDYLTIESDSSTPNSKMGYLDFGSVT